MKKAFAALACIFLSAGVMAAVPLPPSPGAPDVGQQAPEFRLSDCHGHAVSLAQLRGAGARASWVLLVFYRGYW